MIALQVVRTSFGFHLRDCMGSSELACVAGAIRGKRIGEIRRV